MSTDAEETPSPDRMVITLAPPAAHKTRELARQMGVRPPEAIRRGLSLLALVQSLGEGEELMVRRANDRLDRILPIWE